MLFVFSLCTQDTIQSYIFLSSLWYCFACKYCVSRDEHKLGEIAHHPVTSEGNQLICRFSTMSFFHKHYCIQKKKLFGFSLLKKFVVIVKVPALKNQEQAYKDAAMQFFERLVLKISSRIYTRKHARVFFAFQKEAPFPTLFKTHLEHTTQYS